MKPVRVVERFLREQKVERVYTITGATREEVQAALDECEFFDCLEGWAHEVDEDVSSEDEQLDGLKWIADDDGDEP